MRLERTARGLARGLIGVWTALALAAGVFAFGPPVRAAAVEPVPEASLSLVQWINEARLEQGRRPLARDPLLDRIALQKARDMAENGYFDHVSPTFGTIFEMLSAEGVDYKWAGENIARAPDEKAAHVALMQSPEHRANILSAGYTHVGVGAVRDGSRLYVAQVFARPRALKTAG